MDTLEIKQLAEHALGLTPDQTDRLIDNGEDYDTPLKDRFNVDLDTFGHIAQALMAFTPIIQHPGTKQLIHAFVSFQNGCGHVIASQSIRQEQDATSESEALMTRNTEK